MAFLFSVGSFCRRRSWSRNLCASCITTSSTDPAQSECKTFLPDMLSCFNAAETQNLMIEVTVITNVGSSGIAREMLPSYVYIVYYILYIIYYILYIIYYILYIIYYIFYVLYYILYIILYYIILCYIILYIYIYMCVCIFFFTGHCTRELRVAEI